MIEQDAKMREFPKEKKREKSSMKNVIDRNSLKKGRRESDK